MRVDKGKVFEWLSGEAMGAYPDATSEGDAIVMFAMSQGQVNCAVRYLLLADLPVIDETFVQALGHVSHWVEVYFRSEGWMP